MVKKREKGMRKREREQEDLDKYVCGISWYFKFYVVEYSRYEAGWYACMYLGLASEISCGVTVTNPYFADLVRITPLFNDIVVGEEGVESSFECVVKEEGGGAPKRVCMGSRQRPVEDASTSTKWSSDRVL